jgi:phosphatidate cytidylyltransferase
MSYGEDPPHRYRARRDDAAPEPYPWHRYGDGLSAHPLYADPALDTPTVDGMPAIPAEDRDHRDEAEDDLTYAPAAGPEEPIRPPIGESLDEPEESRARQSDVRPTTGRAGRNLPAAIGVGLGLGLVVVASLFVWRPAFLGVLTIAVGIGIWEMVHAVRPRAHPPLVPLVGGGVLMVVLGWFGGAAILPLGLLAVVVAVLVWRLHDGPESYQRDVTAAVLVAVYVPFLASFAALLAHPPDGAFRVLVTLAGVVLSDTGGYLFGVLFGRHPMAPSVSPKKSWEGLGGSMACAAGGSAVLLHFTLHTQYWQGALFGLAVSCAAVVGDLAESMLKRDLKIKDMSNLLPGHGGLMDRLDSILLAVPTAYAILAVIAPSAM